MTDNLHGRLDAAECGERIPATLSKVFGHSGDTDKFEQTKFLNFRHECGNVIRSRLASWNPQGREWRIRRGTGEQILPLIPQLLKQFHRRGPLLTLVMLRLIRLGRISWEICVNRRYHDLSAIYPKV
jgi:hypothetical protein